jgi:hypothetical protein
MVVEMGSRSIATAVVVPAMRVDGSGSLDSARSSARGVGAEGAGENGLLVPMAGLPFGGSGAGIACGMPMGAPSWGAPGGKPGRGGAAEDLASADCGPNDHGGTPELGIPIAPGALAAPTGALGIAEAPMGTEGMSAGLEPAMLGGLAPGRPAGLAPEMGAALEGSGGIARALDAGTGGIAGALDEGTGGMPGGRDGRAAGGPPRKPRGGGAGRGSCSDGSV